MQQRTAARELIEAKLGQDLDVLLAERPQSWRSLSAHIERETGKSVSRETLRQWLAPRTPA